MVFADPDALPLRLLDHPARRDARRPRGRRRGDADTDPETDAGTDVDTDTDPQGSDADGDGSPDEDDCDDPDATVYPGAPQVCGHGVDSDCDGAVETCLAGTYALADADVILVGENSGDCVGLCRIGGADYDGDGAVDDVVGADFQSGQTGAVYVAPGTASGSYDLPRLHPGVGPLWPAADAVARAIARQTASHIKGSGPVAVNALGLTTQVPANPVFLTDGPSRRVHLGRLVVELRHAGRVDMLLPDSTAGLVIVALPYPGARRRLG